MKKTRKYFGTDGVRGEVGQSCIAPEFILKLGWAVGKVLANGDRKKVIIGKDTRVSGYMLESALEAGLSSAGVDVSLLGPMPTPAIAYLTRTLRAAVGIVISASHNSFEYNGIKFFSSDGFKLPDPVEALIEKQLDLPLVCVRTEDLGKAARVNDAPGRYIEFCKSTIPPSTRLNGLKIVLDCANGATYHIAPNVFEELGASVTCLSNKPNGFNINADCGSVYPEALRQVVCAEGADLGIAFDGDGDRVTMVDAHGEILEGDELLYIIAKDRFCRHHLKGGVVGTVMSNMGLERAISALGLDFERAQVGDRYVLEMLREKGWKLGGESSGHIICLDKITTGDGIIAALQVLYAMHNFEKPLHELKQGMQKDLQVKVNVTTQNGDAILTHPHIIHAVSQIEQKLYQKGRVLLRASGTEPMVRVMVEGNDLKDIESYAHELKALVEGLDRSTFSPLGSI